LGDAFFMPHVFDLGPDVFDHRRPLRVLSPLVYSIIPRVKKQSTLTEKNGM
jgi:hypothetical protein